MSDGDVRGTIGALDHAMTIFETIKRLRRLPRHHRIAHLKSCIDREKPRSIRRSELVAALRQEMTAQLKAENRAA